MISEDSLGNFESFLDILSKPDNSIARAIALIRALAQSGDWKRLGIFNSDDPGDPRKIDLWHMWPVLFLRSGISFATERDLEESFLKPLRSVERAMVLIAGESNPFLTSLTLRKENASNEWTVFRIGRSHFVEWFRRFTEVWESGETILAGERVIEGSSLWAQPLATLRMPDRRQHHMVVENISADPGDHARRYLFFPVYEDPVFGLDKRRALTLEDLGRAMDAADTSTA